MSTDKVLVKISTTFATWAENPRVQRAVAIVMGFVWGVLVGIVVTLLIVAGI